MRYLELGACAAVLLLTATGFSQEFAALAPGGSAAAGHAAQPTDAPLSVFNDQVRRFRFVLEHTLVTAETAEAFMVRYNGSGQPEIIGAYADPDSNALLVVGPPEAEQAIRISLATWIVEQQGVYPPPLEAQKRVLQHQRCELLREMAELEVRQVQAETEGDSKAEKVAAQLAEFESELRTTERQIEVVDRYIARRDAPATAK